ncbi:MAG TPA: hypothetical protein VLB07_08240 [Woeseiaceae bacterium]|nr:hypothetical protein [Woeseiaceae bacterium]
MTLPFLHRQFVGALAPCACVFPQLGVLLLLAISAQAQDVNVLAANYEFDLSIDDQVYSIQDRSLVRSGNEIPVELQNYKVGLRVSDSAADGFRVQLSVYERNGADWYPITVPPPEFEGSLGIPTEFAWESGGIKLDIAIVVSHYTR